MKKWQIENSKTSEISEILEILFRVFLFPSFRFRPLFIYFYLTFI